MKTNEESDSDSIKITRDLPYSGYFNVPGMIISPKIDFELHHVIGFNDKKIFFLICRLPKSRSPFHFRRQ